MSFDRYVTDRNVAPSSPRGEGDQNAVTYERPSQKAGAMRPFARRDRNAAMWPMTPREGETHFRAFTAFREERWDQALEHLRWLEMRVDAVRLPKMRAAFRRVVGEPVLA
jgi:hypothetical protein